MVSKMSKRVVALVLVCLMVCSFTACNLIPLKGTYTCEGPIKQSFTFKDDNKVVVSAFDIDGAEGEYVIEDGKIIITYSIFGLSYDLEKSFKREGNSIFIDGTEFVKE